MWGGLWYSSREGFQSIGGVNNLIGMDSGENGKREMGDSKDGQFPRGVCYKGEK